MAVLSALGLADSHLAVISALGLADSPRRGRDYLYIWIWQPAALGSACIYEYSISTLLFATLVSVRVGYRNSKRVRYDITAEKLDRR